MMSPVREPTHSNTSNSPQSPREHGSSPGEESAERKEKDKWYGQNMFKAVTGPISSIKSAISERASRGPGVPRGGPSTRPGSEVAGLGETQNKPDAPSPVVAGSGRIGSGGPLSPRSASSGGGRGGTPKSGTPQDDLAPPPPPPARGGNASNTNNKKRRQILV